MKNKCGNCTKYIQHYGIFDGKLRKVFYGHCMEKNKCNLDEDSAACNLFVPGDPMDTRMVSKEYLTKELLQKVLSMSLLESESCSQG